MSEFIDRKNIFENEVYSATTRQSRTALNLSSATLGVYSCFGNFDNGLIDTFKYIPGGFSVDQIWFGWMAGLAVTYFWASFLLSALKDKRWFDEPKLLVKVESLANSLNKQVDEIEHHLGDIFNRTNKILVGQLAALEKIDRMQLKTAMEQDFNAQKRAALDECLKFLHALETDEERRSTLANFSNDNERRVSRLNESILELRQQINKVKSRTKGILELKDNWFDFIGPLAFGSFAILSFVYRLVFAGGGPIVESFV